MSIPKHFIQDLLARVDIVELIQGKTSIKKRGANYLGICPFHQEKSPSFTVSQVKQFYHCFGCGKHGNAIGFLMDFDRMEFVEAVEELARTQGLEVPDERRSAQTQAQRDELQDLYTLMAKAGKFYEERLRTSPLRQKAVDYLKERGLSGLTAKQFGLGLAPPGWENLLQFLQPQKLEIALLKQAGLISENDQGKIYDKFRDRIMFPIRDRRGRVVAFGGRVIDQGEPKYLNSPETPLFHKGRMLYGLFEAKQKRHTFQQLLVVEGYMDVVMLAEHGIDYALGTLGTATTRDHLRLLKQECHEIIFCFDGDRAGREAAWRALKVALTFMTGELDIRFLLLPDAEDPDSLVRREGKALFEKRLRTGALSLADFMFIKLDEGLNLKSPSGRSRWMMAFKPLYTELPHGPYKTFLLDTVAKRFNCTFEQTLALLDQNDESFTETFKPNMQLDLEQKGLALLLQYPKLAQLEFTMPENVTLKKLIGLIKSETVQNTGQIMEYFREEQEGEYFARLAMHPYPAVINDLDAEWREILAKLHHDPIAALESLQTLAKTRTLTPAEKESLLNLHTELKNRETR